MKRRMLTLFIVLVLAGCGEEPRHEEVVMVPEETGTLVLTANGEDFVREEFTSKDGWEIALDHVYLTLADIQPARTDPPFKSDSDMEFIGERDLLETVQPVTVDLKVDSIVEVAILSGAPEGYYNAISWKLVPAEEGPSVGYSILLQGTATKDGEILPVLIGFESSWLYEAGEYVGDQRRGALRSGSEAILEMTFHMDRLFGDGSLPAEDRVNTDALGFEPFGGLADSARVTDLALLEGEMSAEDYQVLFKVLACLGHVGEGHARCTELQSEPSTDEEPTAP